VTPCAVCTMHMKMRNVSLLVKSQNQGRRFVSGLASKPLRRFSPVWPEYWWLGFLGLGLKTSISDLVSLASKSPQRFSGLGLKTMQASVYRLRHKTDGGRTAWDMRQHLAACFA
jgi:hypothetical protein